MEAARGQPVLSCALHERSRVAALAGLLALDLPMLHKRKHCLQRRRR